MLISIIPQTHCRIIERFGRPVKVQTSGLAFKWPLIEQVKNVALQWGNETNKDGVFIELTEQTFDTKRRDCFTKDNVKVSVNCIFRWRIIDVLKAVYEIDQLHVSLIEVVLTSIRSEIGNLTIDQVLNARETLSERILGIIASTTARWGVKLSSVEIQDIQTDDQTTARCCSKWRRTPSLNSSTANLTC